MNSFCTLFDSFYLSRGLALYRSLVETGEEFTLYVFCFDQRTYDVLRAMHLPYAVPVALAEFETSALLNVKGERSRAEYCWTCTPHVIRYALERFGLPMVTYLDADLYFYAKPSLLLAEYEKTGSSVLITEHRYPERYAHLLKAGIYCVQFITFRADERGITVLSWWQERCLEWCYDRFEDDKFGDQKYLDVWPERFAGVHSLQHHGGGVAPWNVQRYRLIMRGGRPFVIEKNSQQEYEVVFYHFHHLRFYQNSFLELGHYSLDREVKRHLYRPYLDKLEECSRDIGLIAPGFDPNGPVPPARGIVKALGRLQRRLQGNYLPYEKYRSM